MDQNPAQPIIIETQNQKSSGSLVKILPKLLFLIIALVIVFEIYLGVKSLNAPKPKRVAIQPMTDGKITLTTPKSEYRVGERIPLSIRVFTGGNYVSGVDLVLKYDNKLIQASGSGIVASTGMFDEYPLKQVDDKLGSIQLSGIVNSKSKGFNGGGVFANINLVARSKGSAKFTVDFKPGLTNESNIVDSRTGQDILSKVYDKVVTIK